MDVKTRGRDDLPRQTVEHLPWLVAADGNLLTNRGPFDKVARLDHLFGSIIQKGVPGVRVLHLTDVKNGPEGPVAGGDDLRVTWNQAATTSLSCVVSRCGRSRALTAQVKIDV